MKTSLMMSARRASVAAVLVLIACSSACRAQQSSSIRMTLDASGVRDVLTAIERGDTSTAALQALVQRPMVQAVIRKMANFDKRSTDENYITGMRALITGAPLGDDPFQFGRLKTRLPLVREMLARIEKDPDAFARDVKAMMAPFAPAGMDFDAKVALVVAGTSDGWVPGGNTFFESADMVQGDYSGAVLLAAHELYHIAQSQFMAPRQHANGPQNLSNAEMILVNTVKEGSASFMANPLNVQNGGGYITWFQGKFNTNIRYIEPNFALFEALLFRAFNDPAADASKLYLIGFSGIYGSPLYFVGMRMAKMIDKYDGRAALIATYQKPVPQFFTRYMQLYRQHPEDAEFVKFSAEVERILKEL
jgi:hypothetical protein